MDVRRLLIIQDTESFVESLWVTRKKFLVNWTDDLSLCNFTERHHSQSLDKQSKMFCGDLPTRKLIAENRGCKLNIGRANLYLHHQGNQHKVTSQRTLGWKHSKAVEAGRFIPLQYSERSWHNSSRSPLQTWCDRKEKPGFKAIDHLWNSIVTRKLVCHRVGTAYGRTRLCMRCMIADRFVNVFFVFMFLQFLWSKSSVWASVRRTRESEVEVASTSTVARREPVRCYKTLV